MTEAIAGFVAWLGAAAIVLADGRRGLALGLGLSAVGLGVLAWQSAGAIEGGALLAGGAIAAGRRWQVGPAGWNAMPAGSTPRLVTCLGGGLLALWIALSVMQGSGAGLRFGVLSVIGLATARGLATDEVGAATTAAAALVLGAATGAAIQGTGPGPLPYLGAAVVAAGAAWFPRKVAADAH